MKLILHTLILLVLISCQENNKGDGSSIPGSTPGGGVNTEEAKSFIKETNSQIPPNLQIHPSELDSWQQEGLLTAEEAAELSQSL